MNLPQLLVLFFDFQKRNPHKVYGISNIEEPSMNQNDNQIPQNLLKTKPNKSQNGCRTPYYETNLGTLIKLYRKIPGSSKEIM